MPSLSNRRAGLIWIALATVVVLPIFTAAFSPLLAWRSPIYIVASFAGIIAMAVLLVQPLLALGVLPGLKMPASRRCHRWFGFGLLAAVGVHVGGLWLTSPPDVMDALLLRSPTPFSVYGVAAMWMLFLTAGIALYRKRLRPLTWRRVHLSLAAFIALSTILHVLLIEGTMGTASKVILSGLVVLAIAVAIRRSRLKG